MPASTTPAPPLGVARGADPPPLPIDHCVELPGVDWDGYEAILSMRGERRSPRIWYLDGSLTFMSPSVPHESFSDRLYTFVLEVCRKLRIACGSASSATLRWRGARGGVEADAMFYIANRGRVEGKESYDFDVDPPPDLVIEVVMTHPADKALEMYRRLGVPEVWVCERSGLRFLGLSPEGDYRIIERGLAFPFLTPAEVFPWIDRPPMTDDAEWAERLSEWIVETLGPRMSDR